jgi:catechol 2,3-dioxygenase-like lactoylglutathione lyase family enzyme
MPAHFNIIGIDHVVLRATDPTKLERFYLDVLGLSFEKRQGELPQLRAGNALIDIVPANEPGLSGDRSNTGGANLDHLCLQSLAHEKFGRCLGRRRQSRLRPLLPGIDKWRAGAAPRHAA